MKERVRESKQLEKPQKVRRKHAEITMEGRPSKSFSCHDPLLRDPYDSTSNPIIKREFGFMGLLRPLPSLSLTPFADDART
jgi:hypothetical protein